MVEALRPADHGTEVASHRLGTLGHASEDALKPLLHLLEGGVHLGDGVLARGRRIRVLTPHVHTNAAIHVDAAELILYGPGRVGNAIEGVGELRPK